MFGRIFHTLGYKHANLLIFSSLVLVQASRWSLKRKRKLESLYTGDGKVIDEIFGNVGGDVTLKRLDSRGFWAILEHKDHKTKHDIYIKGISSKNNSTVWESLAVYKNKPYLIKRDILKLISQSYHEDDDLQSWEFKKMLQTTTEPEVAFSGNNNRGKATAILFLLGFIFATSYFSSMYFKFRKLLPCISFIKYTCKNNPQISNEIGKNAKIKALDGKITPNYFDGTLILSGKKNLTIKMVTHKNKSSFELLKLVIK